ncbi:transcription regulatory SNF2 [Fusarium napiforme]|uniref:Transcription regulatory SNF2 n=1 Tax=Fusarium napiforme TaxID=42672 RepID=A0A8H5N9A8_9HYPO|nr:transcription regulatory SNF2 [Fusarium napiforme]
MIFCLPDLAYPTKHSENGHAGFPTSPESRSRLSDIPRMVTLVSQLLQNPDLAYQTFREWSRWFPNFFRIQISPIRHSENATHYYRTKAEVEDGTFKPRDEKRWFKPRGEKRWFKPSVGWSLILPGANTATVETKDRKGFDNILVGDRVGGLLWYLKVEDGTFKPCDEKRRFKPRHEKRWFKPRDEKRWFKPRDEKRWFKPRDEKRWFKPSVIFCLSDLAYQTFREWSNWFPRSLIYQILYTKYPKSRSRWFPNFFRIRISHTKHSENGHAGFPTSSGSGSRIPNIPRMVTLVSQVSFLGIQIGMASAIHYYRMKAEVKGGASKPYDEKRRVQPSVIFYLPDLAYQAFRESISLNLPGANTATVEAKDYREIEIDNNLVADGVGGLLWYLSEMHQDQKVEFAVSRQDHLKTFCAQSPKLCWTVKRVLELKEYGDRVLVFIVQPILLLACTL